MLVAEIPNALTDLLRRKTPDEICETLRDTHCLSSNGIERRAQVLALIAEAHAEALAHQQRGMVGPTPRILCRWCFDARRVFQCPSPGVTRHHHLPRSGRTVKALCAGWEVGPANRRCSRSNESFRGRQRGSATVLAVLARS